MRYFYAGELEEMETVNRIYELFNLNEFKVNSDDFRKLKLSKEYTTSSIIQELQATQKELLPFPPEGRYSEWCDEIQKRFYENDEDLIKLFKVVCLMSQTGRTKFRDSLTTTCPSVPLGMLAYDEPLSDWIIDPHELGSFFSPFLYWQNYGELLYYVATRLDTKSKQDLYAFLERHGEALKNILASKKWNFKLSEIKLKGTDFLQNILSRELKDFPLYMKKFFVHQIAGTWKYSEVNPKITIINPFQYGSTLNTYTDDNYTNESYIQVVESHNLLEVKKDLFIASLNTLLSSTGFKSKDRKSILNAVQNNSAYREMFGKSTDFETESPKFGSPKTRLENMVSMDI